MNDNDGNLERRKDPKDRRETHKIQKFVDAIQALIGKRSDLKQYDAEKDTWEYNDQEIDEVENILDELRSFDITEVGSLYLTPKKRVVLDKGYGEYFTDADIELFSKEELHNGINVEKFEQRLEEAKQEMGIHQ